MRKSKAGKSTLFCNIDNDDKAGSYIFKQDNEHIKKFYLVVDLESTCWEDSNPAANANSMKKKKSKKKKKNNSSASAQTKGTTPPSTEREIIEIGAVLIEAQSGNFNIVDEVSIFVQPTMRPILSEFCTELTSITQEDVDNAPSFKEAFKQFKDWLYEREDYRCYKFCAWGNFDAAMIETECSRINKKSPFVDTLNLKIKLLHQYKLPNSEAGNLDKACTTLGIEWQGNHHRAIDDARNTAVIMQRMLTDYHSKQATSNLKGDANAAAMTASKAGSRGSGAVLQSEAEAKAEAEAACKEKNNDDDDTPSNTGKKSP